MSEYSTDEAHEIAEIIVAHTRMNSEGLCYCGHKGRLGTSFAVHQAEQIIAARPNVPGRTRII